MITRGEFYRPPMQVCVKASASRADLAIRHIIEAKDVIPLHPKKALDRTPSSIPSVFSVSANELNEAIAGFHRKQHESQAVVKDEHTPVIYRSHVVGVDLLPLEAVRCVSSLNLSC